MLKEIIAILTSSGVIYLVFILSKKIIDLSLYVEKQRSKLASSNRWCVTTGRVRSLGANVDYDYPSIKVQAEFRNRIELIHEKYANVLLHYSFFVNGQEYRSRQISFAPSFDRDLEFISTLTRGSQIKVLYNPENPSECVVLKSTMKHIDEMFMSRLSQEMNSLNFPLSMCAIGFFVSIIL